MSLSAADVVAIAATLLDWIWQHPEDAFHKLLYCVFLYAILKALSKVKDIKDIVVGIRDARSPLWDLRGTVDQLDGLKPIIAEFKAIEPSIRKLGDEMGLLTEKIDANSKKIVDLQLESFSGRTEELVDTKAHPEMNSDTAWPEEDYWEQLQDYWRRNTQRLEHVIENIPDGRTRLAFDRMSRTNYKAIIDRLEEYGFIQRAAANASRELIDLFNRYRPRNRKVSASVVEPLGIVDRQLDEGIVAYDSLNPTVPAQPRSSRSANQGAGFIPVTPTTKSPVSTEKAFALQQR